LVCCPWNATALSGCYGGLLFLERMRPRDRREKEEGTSISSNERSLTIHWAGGHTAFVYHQQGAPADITTAFEFDPGYYGNNFSLRHDESKDSGALEAGTYTVTEILPAGWDLCGIEFEDLDPSTTNAVTNETAVISLAAGETVRVIFHNLPES